MEEVVTITGEEFKKLLDDLQQEVYILRHAIYDVKDFPKGHLVETILSPYLKDAEKRLKVWTNTRLVVVD